MISLCKLGLWCVSLMIGSTVAPQAVIAEVPAAAAILALVSWLLLLPWLLSSFQELRNHCLLHSHMADHEEE